MSIRTNREERDIWQCLYNMLDARVTADSEWPECNVQHGYPNFDNIDTSQPIVWIEQPLLIDRITQQGGRAVSRFYAVRLGIWADHHNGWIGEIGAISGSLIDFFDNLQTVHNVPFTVNLGATTYTDTTLTEQGIEVYDFSGALDTIYQEDEARREFTLYVNT